MRDASVFVWRGEGREPFRIRNYGRVFFQKPRTKFSVFKNIRIRVDGAWSDDRVVISIKKYIPKMWCKTIHFFFFCLLNLFFSSAFRLRRRRRGCSNSLVALPQKHASVQFLICDAGFHWKSGYLMENARRKRRPQVPIERPLIGSQGRLNKEGVMWTVSNITEEPLQHFVRQAIQWAVY